MTNCLDLLSIGGELVIQVPYDLSCGAWLDPTHVRAFNERSWDVYTHSCWYLGWIDHRFDLAKETWLLSPLGFEMYDQNVALEVIGRTPRAVDQLLVSLIKRETTAEEREHNLSFIRD